MAENLYGDEWITVSFDAGTSLVRYTRSNAPYPDVQAVERSFAGLRGAIRHVDPGLKPKLLIDTRRAPPRNDPAFEALVQRATVEFATRFARVATLMATAVGKLQAVRLAHERGAENPHVFDDEQAALAYLGVAPR
jgi:hypothetical protein